MGRNKIETAQSRGRDWVRILLGLVISLIALALVISLIDFKQFVEAIRQANLLYLVLGGSMTLLWLVCRGKAWQTLLKNRATYRDVFFTLNEGYLINNILPFRLGEVARAYLLGRKAHLNFWDVFSTVLIERFLDLAFAVGLLFGTVAFAVNLSWAREVAIGAGVVVFVALVTLYLLARYQTLALDWIEKAGKRWVLVKRVAGTRVASFLNGLTILVDARLFASAVGWIALNWVVVVVQYYVLLLAFIPNAQLLWSTFGLGASALGIAVPSSPGSVGVFEAVLVGALALFGLNVSVTAAYAFFTHFFNYLFTGILGGYELAHEGETFTSIYRQLRRVQRRDAPTPQE